MAEHLPLNEQFEAIQNQAEHERLGISGINCPTDRDYTNGNNTRNYLSLRGFEQTVLEDQPETGQVVANAMQMSIDSPFTEDMDLVSDSVANML